MKLNPNFKALESFFPEMEFCKGTEQQSFRLQEADEVKMNEILLMLLKNKVRINAHPYFSTEHFAFFPEQKVLAVIGMDEFGTIQITDQEELYEDCKKTYGDL